MTTNTASALVRTSGHTGFNGTSGSVSGLEAVTGDAIWVFCVYRDLTGGKVTGVSDGTNTYTGGTILTSAGTDPTNHHVLCDAFIADNVTGGTLTVTATLSTAENVAMVVVVMKRVPNPSKDTAANPTIASWEALASPPNGIGTVYPSGLLVSITTGTVTSSLDKILGVWCAVLEGSAADPTATVLTAGTSTLVDSQVQTNSTSHVVCVCAVYISSAVSKAGGSVLGAMGLTGADTWSNAILFYQMVLPGTVTVHAGDGGLALYLATSDRRARKPD